MWVEIIVVGAIVALIVRVSFLPPLNAITVLRIRNGGAFISGDSLPLHVKLSVAEIIHEAGLKKGFIAITSDRRVKFSRNIPTVIHQRLRNVLLNP